MLKFSHLYGGNVQNPKYSRSEAKDTAKVDKPQKAVSLTRINSDCR